MTSTHRRDQIEMGENLARLRPHPPRDPSDMLVAAVAIACTR